MENSEEGFWPNLSKVFYPPEIDVINKSK